MGYRPLKIPYPRVTADDPAFAEKWQQNVKDIERWAAPNVIGWLPANVTPGVYPPIVRRTPRWYPESKVSFDMVKFSYEDVPDVRVTIYKNTDILWTHDFDGSETLPFLEKVDFVFDTDDYLYVEWDGLVEFPSLLLRFA